VATLKQRKTTSLHLENLRADAPKFPARELGEHAKPGEAAKQPF